MSITLVGAVDPYPAFDPPTEILDHIFSFLLKKTLFQCALVCKQWNGVARSEKVIKKICLKFGFQKKDENQSWIEFMLIQAEFYACFEKGEILNRLPATISTKKDLEIREEEPYIMFDGRDIRTWPTFPVFEIKQQVYISSTYCLSSDQSEISVHLYTKPEKSYLFTVDHRVSALALKGNILALKKFSESEAIQLVDIRGLKICTFDHLDCPPPPRENQIDKMEWNDFTLFTSRKDQSTGQIFLQSLDFSRKSSFELKDASSPLSVKER